MAEQLIEVKEKTESLLKVLDDVQDVYMTEQVCNSAEDIANLGTITELPVIEDSIEVDLGSIDASYTKSTDGTIIAAKFAKGDPSCTMNIATIDAATNVLFADKTKGSAKTVQLKGDKEGVVMQGYSGKVVVKEGTIVMCAANHKGMIAFPRCKVSATFKPTGGGDANTGYWEVTFIPLMNAEGAQFYLSDGSAVGE